MRFKLIGVKNEMPICAVSSSSDDLFEARFDQKVFEIERALLLAKR